AAVVSRTLGSGGLRGTLRFELQLRQVPSCDWNWNRSRPRRCCYAGGLMGGTTMIHRTLLVIAAAFGLLVARSAHAEEGTIRVCGTWEADVHVVPTGLSETTMAGTIFGHVFIDTDQGPIGAGEMECPVIMRQDLKSMSQKGEGQCMFEKPKGNLWFMTISCT